MRKLIICVLSLVLLIACQKDKRSSNPLAGEWVYSQNRISPGYPITEWTDVPSDTFKIEFSINNVFHSNTPLFLYTHYEILNDKELMLSNPPNQEFKLRYKVDGEYLQLNPQCYEECSFRFKR